MWSKSFGSDYFTKNFQVKENKKKMRNIRPRFFQGPRHTDRKQRRLAEKGDPKYIFTIPRAILPKPSLCDEITVTKSVTKTCNEIIASRSVCSRSVDLARFFHLLF